MIPTFVAEPVVYDVSDVGVVGSKPLTASESAPLTGSALTPIVPVHQPRS